MTVTLKEKTVQLVHKEGCYTEGKMEAKKTKIGMIVSGFVLALVGLALSYFFEELIFYKFEQELPLRPGSMSYEKWRLTPVPIIMKVYFWNWTNPDRLGERGYKPNFVEMGPYVFREQHEKVNVSWNENGTVTFRTIKRWYFDETRSNGSLKDEVTSINAVAASAAYIAGYLKRFFLLPISGVLRAAGQELTWTKNVSQLLFDGFDNSIQTIGSFIPGLPDKFGWFYKKNGTISNDYQTIDTGINNLGEIGKLRLWNFKNETGYYPECSKVTGFNGEFWPPKRTSNDTLEMFTTDMCRKVVYYFEEESSYRGLKTLVFAGTKETVDNGTLVAENKCYCDPRNRCVPSGVFDVSKCQFGAPVFLSYPHFYNADPYYRDSIEGMKPSQDKHRFYIALEPRTGVQLKVAARLQVNILIKRNAGISIFRNVKSDLFVPVFWMENLVSLPDDYTLNIKIMLSVVEFGPFICYGMCMIGCLIIVGAILLHLFSKPGLSKKRRKRKLQPVEIGLIQPEEVPLKDIKFDRLKKELEYEFNEISQ